MPNNINIECSKHLKTVRKLLVSLSLLLFNQGGWNNLPFVLYANFIHLVEVVERPNNIILNQFSDLLIHLLQITQIIEVVLSLEVLDLSAVDVVEVAGDVADAIAEDGEA